MVSIGGDRATNADYRRANKEAASRSRSKPKSEKKSGGWGGESKVLGKRLYNDTPSRAPAQRQAAPAQAQSKPKYQKPFEFGLQGHHWESPKGATQPFGLVPDNPQPSKVNEPGAGLFTPDTQGPNAAAVPEQYSLSRAAQQDQVAIALAAGRDPKELGLKPEDVATGSRQPGMSSAQPNPQVPTAAPGTVGFPGVEVPPISDGVREILNDRNWKLPEKGKTVSLGKSSYEKGSLEELEQHDYRLSKDEWDRIEATYSSDAARKAGYIPPSATKKDIDKNTPLMHQQDEDTASLNWKTYEKMTDDQKAAIDFNTLLVEARESDLDKKITLSTPERTKYDETVKRIFGEGGGSDTVATHTVDLLDQLDMDVVGQDLDEYLSLERAFDDTEIGDFKFSKRDVQTLESLAGGEGVDLTPEQQTANYAQIRTPENLASVDTAGVQQAQKMIETKLQDPKADTYDFESLMYGKAKDTQAPPSSFSDYSAKWDKEQIAEFDDWAQWAWGEISAEKPQFTMEQMLGDLDATTRGSTEARQTWLNFIQSRVDMAGQYGSPEESEAAKRIAKYAGLEGS